MAKTCILIPQGDKEADLFLKLKDNFGREDAAYIYNRVITKQFQEAFKDSLEIVEGVPTYQSVLNNTLVKKYLGPKILESLNAKQPHYEDTLDNVNILIGNAKAFNNNNENKNYIAYVDYTTDKELTLHIEERNDDTVEIAENQRKIHELNQRILDFLSPIGLTPGMLSEIEVAVGRVGVTNFNHLASVVGNFADVMKIANNMEGFKALSEEFAHLLIGINRKQPLVTRSIIQLKNPKLAQKVLGASYQDVYDFHNGDMELVAEEALAHLLQDSLIKPAETTNNSLFDRLRNFILRLFKGYNPRYITDIIDSIRNDVGTLAQSYLEGKKKITKQDLQKSERELEFNALSERTQVQMDKLKHIAEDAYKRIVFLTDSKINPEVAKRTDAKDFVHKLDKILKTGMKKEQSVVALYEFLKVAVKDLKQYYTDLTHINDYERKDQASILRATEYTLQAFGKAIKEVREVFTREFIEDPDIAEQLFVLGDEKDELKPYETTKDEPTVSKKTIEETADAIVSNSAKWQLSRNGEYYRNKKTGEKAMRVTTVITPIDERIDKENPWYLPSTNIGTGVDEFTRDCLAGEFVEDTPGHFTIDGKELDEVYPNATRESLNKLATELQNFKTEQERKGIKLIPRDVTVGGNLQIVDSAGNVKTIKVAGTLDLLGYDSKGNWYIYDMKTYRTKIDDKKKEKYTKQLSLYKKLLEDKYGIKVSQIAILPIHVTYPNPLGEGGTAEYSVNHRKAREYKGRESNQLQIDGEDYTGANPTFEPLDTSYKAEELKIRLEDLQKTPLDGVATIMEAIKGVEREMDDVKELFNKEVFEHVKTLFTSVLGETAIVPETDDRGNLTGKTIKVSIEELLKKAPVDNTWLQRMLVTYADNPDPFIQAMSYLVKKAKFEKNQKSIETSQKIMALGLKYEKLGIKEYDWMFEEDKQNYINHIVIDGKDYSYDGSAYKKAKEAFVQNLNKQYGEFPEIGTQAYKDKRKALNDWIDINTTEVKINGKDTIIPLPSKYPSKYHKLSSTQKQFYDEWMEIKTELDTFIPSNATHTTNTIKIRKSGYQRLTSLNRNSLKTFTEGVRANFMKSYDDNLNYAKGLEDFEGTQVNKLPLFYLHTEDASDITTDVIGSLIAYADMVYDYSCMDQVVDSLELAKLVAQDRKIQKTRGKNAVVDKVPYKNGYIDNPLYEGKNSIFLKIIDEFLESKVYGKHIIDSGNIGDTNVDKQKASGVLLKLGSAVQLGFNGMAWVANFLTGTAMQRIDGIAGEHFNMRDLWAADREILADAMNILGDVGKRVKKSKTMLAAEMFNFKQDFTRNQRNKDFLNRNLLTRIFGPHIQFIGQDLGDFFLYSRSGVAILKRYKLKTADGKKISLWKALEVVPIDPSDPSLGNKLQLMKGVTKLDGTAFTQEDTFKITEEIGEINRHCFGIYNDEDSLTARRYIAGRFILQYRDFMPAQYKYRFGKKGQILTKGGETVEFEGYYVTYWEFLKAVWQELKSGEFKMGQVYNSLTDYQKTNVIRARAETLQILALYVLGMIVKAITGGDDDDDEIKDRPWVWRFSGAMYERAKTEWGSLAPFNPTFQMPLEVFRILKSPAAATTVVGDIVNLRKLVWIPNYFDEVESGRYKDHSEAYKAFMESPLTLWYRTIRRQLEPEKAAKYYKD